jgi:hypothetical protein
MFSWWALAGVYLTAVCANCDAGDVAARGAGALELETKQVIVFKDGYCLVVKEGTATTDANGFAHTFEVPDAAVLGSFWAIPENGSIKSMVAGWETKKTTQTKEVNCTDTASIVEANLGRECSFTINSKIMQGTILKMMTNDVEGPTDEQIFAASSSSSSIFLSTNPATHFLLRTKLGDVMVALNRISNLTIEDMVSTHAKKTTSIDRKKKLSLDFGKKNEAVKISLMYFRPDVRWIPTYRVELTDKDFKSKSGSAARKTANISLQGEILNEAEDFENVPFHVVVGVPNFRFKNTPSPMVLEANMRQALVRAAPQIMGQQMRNSNSFSNAMYTQRSGEFQSQRAAGSSGRVTPDMPAELSGQASQDLFVYRLDAMTLKKGERAAVPILTAAVGYRDIYTWDMKIKHSESYAQTSADAPSPLVLSENKVWRQVELINDTDLPWTTGAAMFVDGFQPLAQELMTYTSPGGICRVPVTVAVDLRGKADDREVTRKLSAIKWRGRPYAEIKGKIKAELANNKDIKVPVEVSIRFGGKATEASGDGKITLSAFQSGDWENGADRINNSSHVIWKGEIEPGECFKPDVDYEFLMRH